MRIEEEIKLDFKDVLIKPKRSALKSRSQVNINRYFTFKHSNNEFDGVPIIAANMDTVGTFGMAEVLSEYGMVTALHKHYSPEDLVQFFANANDTIKSTVFYSMGITSADLEKFEYVKNGAIPFGGIKNVCLDVANGYSEPFIDFVEEFRSNNPDVTIMAGNVVTAEVTEALIFAGADVVKVGIGPGSVCTTRVKTGVGYPQLSAVIECADAAHGLGGHICSDGGCTVPGDVAKAFGGGADFVMLGGMLAGHDECDGELFEMNGQQYMKFYGMSSETAMEKHAGGVAEYRASEGKTVEIPYKGPAEITIRDILGGLRSSCTYVGASKLKELSKRTTFIRVTQQENLIYGKEKS